MLDRRSLLRGLVAAPAVVAIGSLMPIRGIIMPVRGELRFSDYEVLYKGEALVKQTFAYGPPRYLTATEGPPRHFTEITRDEWWAIVGAPRYNPYNYWTEVHHGHTAPAA